MLRRTKVLICCLFISAFSLAQKSTHTPYSVFGLGELKLNDYAAYLSMGSVSMAGNDSTMVNPSNPASFSYIGRLRPILQVGANGRFSEFETASLKTTQRHFGLNQFQLGIPIKRRWGAAIGLKPYSFTGYFISDYTVDEDDDTTALLTSEGKGGINKFYLGVAYQPLVLSYKKQKERTFIDSSGNKFSDSVQVGRIHQLSIGANANYLFGSTKRIRTFQFASSAQGLNSKVDNSLRLKDFLFDFGLHYQFRWKSYDLQGKVKQANGLAVGLTYSPGMKMKSFQDIFSYSYLNIGGFNGSEIPSDTIELINDNEGTVFIPESYKGGVEWRFGPKSREKSSLVRIGIDGRYQKWSKYSEDFGDDFDNQLKDRLQLGLGIEWTPNAIPAIRDPFMGKIHYRIGFNYTMTELQFETSPDNYTGLTAYGMSLGFGIPVTIIPNSNTNINFGANLGRLGTTEHGLIQENYLGMFFGLSITPGNGDLWFLKRKYD